ncbi:rhombosortase-dependent M36 family metallopeptidase [Shewanella sp. D64]|uniref:rhombosortase-dependent M36 family metallopeptidase n=1 Tax=unclassified Shewanella TaxID=196818 RepID=UPI0022BA51DD|nr:MULTISPECIES: rhombosortase-dependent M36 family metallopeptidase [unclassified Shewanella]MEC4728896.1 rhombosortase-dependent M36 family metallopeptidase [Shewanella sp. D64]MEC4740770.1 rhombosortase-dependent M36 family metallopeptidase [Shewanella sp. E94]WBJ94488.1 rhombosortase-dependent M36 family metallopeptidase [Shewanella sp. MTB7]
MKTKLSIAITAALVSSSAYSAPQPVAISQLQLNPQLQNVYSLKKPASITGMRDQFDATSKQETFQWAKKGQQTPALSALEHKYKATTAADFYLNKVTGLSTVKKGNVQAVLSSVHDIGRGSMVAKYTQRLNGIQVFNHEVNIMMDREFNMVAASGKFANHVSSKHNRIEGLQADFGDSTSAINTAFHTMGGSQVSLAQSPKDPSNQFQSYTASVTDGNKQIVGEPRSKQVYFMKKGSLVPAFYIEIQVAETNSVDSEFYSFVINAETNKVLFKHNLTSQDADFNYRVYADETGVPWDSPHGNVIPAMSADQTDSSEYLDAPMVIISSGPISTKDAWLSDDATTTSGNNVNAYVDAIAPDGFTNGDFTAEVTSSNTFDYKYNTAEVESSVNNRKAATVNLFYLNNYLHDTFYDHGFDEAAGNAQALNYDRGGVEGDALRAEVQDNSGFNNANMSTPADGASPRMQMYLWDSKDAIIGEQYGVTVTSDDAIGLLLSTQRASFGQGQFDISGDVVRITDDTAPTSDGCEAAVNGAELAGKIAIIDRGACNFTQKAKNAQDAGAIAVLIANNSGTDEPAPMGGSDDDVKIPSMGLSLNDGAKIYAKLDAAENVTISMFNQKPYKASSWDNAIVAHEWGHYISNRLVGNASGLINQQGRSMGEGWGDFHALLLISEEDDALIAGNELFQKAYAAVSYVGSFYTGIRNYPYSTDMEINPLTFANVELGNGTGADRDGNAEVHDAGEPWAAMLWDSYVALINDERHTFSEARSLMMDYLVSGYKMTPIAPTYTEARDAILAAAFANDVKDYELILGAFARRGMGLGAVSPERFDTKHNGVVESFKTKLATFSVSEHNLNTNYEGMTTGYCSNDNILDKGETGTVSFTVANRGSEDFESIEGVVEVTSGHDVTFANEGKVSFAAVPKFGEATSTPLEFTLNDAGVAEEVELKITFPELTEEVEASEYKLSTVVNMDFVAKEAQSNMSTSDMEDYSGLVDLKEMILSGGELAEGTSMLDGTYASFFPVDSQYMFIANNGFASDVAFETKPVTVGYAGDFTVSWFQYYEIEDAYDGGVVELSINGSDWTDVTKVGGTFEGAGYDGELADLLPGRSAFTGVMPWPGGTETVNFGTALNGNEVKFRFRIVSDTNTNSFGWIVDNVTFKNISSDVFHTQVAGDSLACDNRLPSVTTVASAESVKEGEAVTLTATAVDANEADTLTYIWTQTSGTEATLTGADTATASFSAPLVSADEALEFTVTVNDGTADVVSNVSVTVTDIPAVVTPPAPKKSSGGSTGLLTLLLLPLALLRRRR